MRSPRTGTQARRLELRLTLLASGRSHTLVLPPLAVTFLLGILPLAALGLVAAACYFVFHDDLLAGLTRRQIAMQYGYEDRIARMRHEIVNLTQRAKINDAELAARVAKLAEQQNQLENRTILVTALATRMRALRDPAKPQARQLEADPGLSAAVDPSRIEPLTTADPYLPASDFAAPLPRSGQSKPRPEGFELRLDNIQLDAPKKASSSATSSPLSFDVDLPLTIKLDRITARAQQLDHMQLALLDDLRQPAERISARIHAALRATGLSFERLNILTGRERSSRAAEGGPFVPLPSTGADGAAFTRAAIEAQSAIAAAERLRSVSSHLPLAAPLSGPLEVTSPFGPRIDPFLGRPALHTGIDLRDDYGDRVAATADGTVVFAGSDGGYGNMVEIDHGSGIHTRYAHLSSLAVSSGERVKTGTIIGRIGETGRATGPHLHYETRIDGEPVNPARFLKAGLLLRTARAAPGL